MKVYENSDYEIEFSPQCDVDALKSMEECTRLMNEGHLNVSLVTGCNLINADVAVLLSSHGYKICKFKSEIPHLAEHPAWAFRSTFYSRLGVK